MLPVDPILAVAIYVVIWWLCLFVVLPIGVRSVEEAAEEAPGHERGAPVAPNLRQKLVWTSALAAGFWVVALVVIAIDPWRLRG